MTHTSGMSPTNTTSCVPATTLRYIWDHKYRNTLEMCVDTWVTGIARFVFLISTHWQPHIEYIEKVSTWTVKKHINKVGTHIPVHSPMLAAVAYCPTPSRVFPHARSSQRRRGCCCLADGLDVSACPTRHAAGPRRAVQSASAHSPIREAPVTHTQAKVREHVALAHGVSWRTSLWNMEHVRNLCVPDSKRTTAKTGDNNICECGLYLVCLVS